ncbi:MAG: hypothetical protein FVQ82_08685 [Planctomycetes bacterium]|nr:hypothetical protein [Planctomycetota bacterium]
MNNTQPLLFDIPSIAETGVWCTLADGIDPAQWAGICRKIGQLSPDQFQEAINTLFQPKPSNLRTFASSTPKNPDSLISRLKRVFCFNQAECSHLPLVSIGPEGINA